MDVMFTMCLYLMFYYLLIDVVDVFTQIRKDVHIIKVINFTNLSMMYKIIKWFMVLSAPILWFGLLIMSIKGKKILYWWYPSVKRHIIEK